MPDGGFQHGLVAASVPGWLAIRYAELRMSRDKDASCRAQDSRLAIEYSPMPNAIPPIKNWIQKDDPSHRRRSPLTFDPHVSIDTAGGGGHQSHNQRNPWQASHHGLIEGVADTHRIRDLIMARLGRSRTAGLGDENLSGRSRAWSSEQVATLRKIRELIAAFT